MSDVAAATAPKRRGRPPGSGKKATENPPSALTQVAGSSGSPSVLTNEQNGTLLFHHLKRMQDARAAVAAARTAEKNAKKAVVGDLGKFGVEMIDTALLIQTPEGRAKVESEHARRVQVAMMLNLPLGAQSELFKPDRRTRDEIAFGEGFQDGAGGDQANPSKWGAETKPGQSYMRGYHAGQSSIYDIRKLQGAPLFRGEKLPDEPTAEGAEASETSEETAAGDGDGGEAETRGISSGEDDRQEAAE